MKRLIRNGMFVLMVALSYTTAFSSPLTATTTSALDPVYDWTEYLTVDGIKIEYKYQAFESGPFRNQLLILFKYTNISTDSKSITWSTKEYRDEVCTNCNQINDSEYSRKVSLTPGEVIEGKALDASKTEEYLFSNFVKLVPGMTNQRLTDFEFVNINVSTL